jgi:hypothetical protein
MVWKHGFLCVCESWNFHRKFVRSVTCAVTTESLFSDLHIYTWIFDFLSRNCTELVDKFRQRWKRIVNQYWSNFYIVLVFNLNVNYIFITCGTVFLISRWSQPVIILISGRCSSSIDWDFTRYSSVPAPSIEIEHYRFPLIILNSQDINIIDIFEAS